MTNQTGIEHYSPEAIAERIEADTKRRIAEAVASEREACAKIADSSPDDQFGHIAAAIRARGDNPAERREG